MAAAALALAGCAPNPNGLGVADFGGLQGTVIDRRTMKPIQSATIQIGGRTLQLNPGANGVFSFGVDQIPVGNETLTVFSAGYSTASVQVTIRKGEVLNLTEPIAMDPTS